MEYKCKFCGASENDKPVYSHPTKCPPEYSCVKCYDARYTRTGRMRKEANNDE